MLTSIVVGSEPDGAAYDSANGDVYVTNFGTSTVSVLSDTSTYQDNSCTTAQSTFASGSSTAGTVYASEANITGSVTFTYIDPSGATKATNVYTVSGGSQCDSKCYTLQSGDPTGTWQVKVTGTGGPSSATFTVGAPVPEFPLGILPLLLAVPVIYLLARRVRSSFSARVPIS